MKTRTTVLFMALWLMGCGSSDPGAGPVTVNYPLTFKPLASNLLLDQRNRPIDYQPSRG